MLKNIKNKKLRGPVYNHWIYKKIKIQENNQDQKIGLELESLLMGYVVYDKFYTKHQEHKDGFFG